MVQPLATQRKQRDADGKQRELQFHRMRGHWETRSQMLNKPEMMYATGSSRK